jgi:hypothetical protein
VSGCGSISFGASVDETDCSYAHIANAAVLRTEARYQKWRRSCVGPSAPRLFLARLDIRSRPDACNLAQFLKPNVRTCTSSDDHGIVRRGILGHDALDVSMNSPVHRPIERLAGLHSALEKPTPARRRFHFPVRGLAKPRHRRQSIAGIYPVVEEYYERAPPKSANRDRMIPAPWSLHLVRGEVRRIDLRFGQVEASGSLAAIR